MTKRLCQRLVQHAKLVQWINLLDFVSGIFGKSSAQESREEKRMTALKAASEAAPVRAEKPQAPIQYERNEVEVGPESNYKDDYNEESKEIEEVVT